MLIRSNKIFKINERKINFKLLINFTYAIKEFKFYKLKGLLEKKL